MVGRLRARVERVVRMRVRSWEMLVEWIWDFGRELGEWGRQERRGRVYREFHGDGCVVRGLAFFLFVWMYFEVLSTSSYMKMKL